MVEGQARFRLREYPANNRIGIREDIGSGNSQRFDPRDREPLIARFVSLWPVAPIVCFPIDLDCKARVAAKEVKNVAPGRVLPPKL